MVNGVSSTSLNLSSTLGTLTSTLSPDAGTLFAEALQNILTDDSSDSSEKQENTTQQLLMTMMNMTMLNGMNGVSGEFGALFDMLLILCRAINNKKDNETQRLTEYIEPRVNALSYEESEKLRLSLMNDPDISNETKDSVNDTVFKSVTATALNVYNNPNAGSIPYEAWKPVSPSLTSDTDNRSAINYRAVIDQFNVETNGRYTPYKMDKGDTYCNIFVWDVTRAMGAEIPHYVDSAGNAVEYPNVKGSTEQTARAIDSWLRNYGEKNGWIKVTAEQAQAFANAGNPTVATWLNPTPGRSSHVQIVCPSKDGKYDPVRGVTVAQSGKTNTDYSYMSQVMNSSYIKDINYYVHM